MNKELAKKYIQFAVDNWYMKNKIQKIINIEFLDYNWNIIIYSKKYSFNLNIIQIIMSDPFITSISKWIDWKTWLWNLLDTKIKNITIQQAIAIRDWKLEEFIKNLLNNNIE